MAGRPMYRAFARRMDAIGGIDALCDMVREPTTIKAIGVVFDVSRQIVYQYINDDKHPERRAKYQDAKRDSADALAEEALEILDEPVADSADASRAKNRADYRRWLAGVRNREEFGKPEDRAPGVTINLGSLHLDALMAAVPAALPIPEAEYTVEEPEDA